MRFFRSAFARIAGMFAGRRADEELREELEAHLEMETAENIRRGMSAAAARRRALLASGGVTQAAEAVREQRGLPWLEQLAADVRYAVRTLRRSPGFTAVVVVTLALGIGANTAIYSVIRGVLLKPLPHRDGDRLVYLRHSIDQQGASNILFSVPEVRDYRAGAPALGGIAEYCPWYGYLQGREGPIRVALGLVTGNFFEVMGLSPVLGRLTRPSDDGQGVPPVMVLTHDYWVRRFGGDSGVVGRLVRLDGTAVTVIGVLQAAPSFPDRVDAWTNMVVSQHHLSAFMVLNRSHRMTEMVARLAPGATLQQARSQVAAVDARAQREFRDAYDPSSHYRVAVIPFKQVIGERARLTLWLLMASAAFVLVIAAANVTNLTLMRGVRREHELVTRAALGSGVARLRRLLLAENLVLTVTSALLGVIVAIGAVRMLIPFADRYSPRAGEIHLDAPVLAYTLALSVLLALVLSFAASLPREGAFGSWVASGGLRTAGSVRKQRLQRALVVAQVAVSVVLLAGAGLLTRTLTRLSDVPTGLVTEDVLSMTVPLMTPAQALTDPKADVAAKLTYGQMRDAVRGLRGVVEAGVGSTMPLMTSQMALDFKLEGKAPAPGEPTPNAEFRTASPEYFRAAGIPLRRGRAFDITDRPGSGMVVIINQTFADRYFPGEDPLGRRIAMTGEILKITPFSDGWRTIVGVVGTTQDGGLDAAPRPVVFMPFAQELAFFGGLVIRSETDPSALTADATRLVRGIAPMSPVENVRTVAQTKDLSLAPRRLNAALISSFGILALIIAAVGIGGVLGFAVSARTHEIGIRMSLGADGGRVQRMILREGGVLLAVGLALGVVGAYLGSGVIRGLLFGVAPHDPGTYIAVGATMAVIGLGACWIPALRAARIDPAITLRSE